MTSLGYQLLYAMQLKLYSLALMMMTLWIDGSMKTHKITTNSYFEREVQRISLLEELLFNLKLADIN